MTYLIIFGFFFLLGLVVDRMFTNRYSKYSKEFLASGMTGKEVAEKMLHDHGIYDVSVISVKGKLTDHYNPIDKTVNLSQEVYNNSSIAAAAVAAHECGHAVQHATAYHWITLRSRLVPIVNACTYFYNYVLLAGVFMITMEKLSNIGYIVALIGIGMFAVSTLFAFVTLPVEFNASSRAIDWLEGNGIVSTEQQEHAKSALRWAASTYVVAALASLATLLYFIMRFRQK